MVDTRLIYLGIVLARNFDVSVEDVESLKFMVIPPTSPWIYRIPTLNEVYPWHILSDTPEVFYYEDVTLIPFHIKNKNVRIGYSKKQNIVLIDSEVGV